MDVSLVFIVGEIVSPTFAILILTNLDAISK
jgi:hypothetical protein